jgi:hypothetical protein
MIRSLLAALLAAAALPASAAAAPEWLAGDFHVHSTYSHDSYGGPGDDNTGPEDINTFGFPITGEFAMAEERGLDFLAITDHNDVRSQSDPGWEMFGIIGVPGYENSLSGHAQMLGATKVYPKPANSHSAEDVQALADALRADGGVFQINHPADSTSPDPDDLDWFLGYAVQPDTVEAWNGPHFYQPPFPASNSHDDAVRFWEGWLDRGAHVTLTGGSDSHWVATAHGQGPGQPTTRVLSEDRTAAGILEGLRRGHTTVSHQPPNLQGPVVYLEGDGDGDGEYESVVGDTVPARSFLRARVEGAPGSWLRIVTDGGKDAFAPVQIAGATWSKRFRLPRKATWARAEVALADDLREVRQANCPEEYFGSYCRNKILVTAMSSALYLEPKKKARAR